MCRQDLISKQLAAQLYVIVQLFALGVPSRCKHDMGALSWLNTETLERVPTPFFDKLVKCSAHGYCFMRLHGVCFISVRSYIFCTLYVCHSFYPLPLLHLPDPNSEDPTSEDSPTTDQAQLARSHFYKSLKLLLSTYWVLVVVGAFLLVILIGQPSLLKTVYLIFFFVFLITYQVCSMI